MDLAELDGIASGLTSVRRSSKDGLAQWRYKGRLVARQLDSTKVVIRTDLASRKELLSRHPGTFHVPPRYEGHMMVVADLESGDDGAIEDALMAAWALQAGHPPHPGPSRPQPTATAPHAAATFPRKRQQRMSRQRAALEGRPVERPLDQGSGLTATTASTGSGP